MNRFAFLSFVLPILLTACGETVDVESTFRNQESLSVYEGNTWITEGELERVPCLLLRKESEQYNFTENWMWEHKTGWELVAQPVGPLMVLTIGDLIIYRTEADRLVVCFPEEVCYERIIGPAAADRIFKCR